MRPGRALLLALAACSCGRGPDVPLQVAPGPLRLPGGLSGPSGEIVDVSGDSAAVIFYWLPLHGYPPVEDDLRFIAGPGGTSSTRVFAVQLDPGSRNAAQTQVNDLGITLPVYLADSALARAIPCGILPVAVMYVRGRPAVIETGSGSVERLLAR
jgi:hypothetical protein